MGRPKGSLNKPKEIKENKIEIKKLKTEIRDLRFKKLSLASGSSERLELHHKIKELKLLLETKKEIKNNIENSYIPDKEKQELIDKIYLAKPQLKVIGVDLRKFTIEQLQHHYNTKIKKG